MVRLVGCLIGIGVATLATGSGAWRRDLLAGESARAAPGDGEGRAPNPWATLRGCLAILERFDQCAADKAFKAFIDRWVAAEAASKATAAEIRRRLEAWSKAAGRREQCAIWARRGGAPEHLGETSALATSARSRSAPCDRYAREIDKDAWVPRALVDARMD